MKMNKRKEKEIPRSDTELVFETLRRGTHKEKNVQRVADKPER